MDWVPIAGHLGFSPVAPTRGPDALKSWKIARERHDEFGLDLLIVFVVGLRELHMIWLVV